MERFESRVALITGAASGIGLATARRLHAEGAHDRAVAHDHRRRPGRRLLRLPRGHPVMAARGSGAIVTISSAIGTVGERNRSAYCAAKSGVENLTRAMALDHGREGIRANCVAPGLIDTPLIRGGKVGGGANPTAMQAMVDAHHAIGRIGQPAEVAAAIAFLASDDASFITASSFLVDGGISAAYTTPL
jgi:NAD(P)-dependent dehydrogenase (short-subunit alcohol dehydrogenase family)